MAARKRTDFIVIHVSATPPTWNGGAAGINAMHKARGWSGIGYHFVINPDGTVEKGRAINQVGAHVAGFNSISLGICLVGGLNAAKKPADTRTAAQNAALINLLNDLVKKYPNAKICGHRDLSPDRDGDGIIEPHEWLKECPCFDAIPWARIHGFPAADIKGIWDTYPPDPTTSTADAVFQPAGPDARNVYLQRLLSRAGYEFGPIDGLIGPKTKAAIQRFQTAAGFKVNGTFDEPTVARLRTMFETPVKQAVEEALFKDHLGRALTESSYEPAPPPPATGFFAFLARFFSIFRTRDDS